MSTEKLHFRKLIVALVLGVIALAAGSVLLSTQLRVMPETPAGYSELQNPLR